MTTVGLLYPGHAAEDDFPRIEVMIDSDIRLPLFHTETGEDAHDIASLRAAGAPERLSAGVEELRLAGAESLVWASTNGSFVYGWEGAHEQVADLARAAGLPASSTSFAFAHAVGELGAGRVAVASIDPVDVAPLFTGFLEAAGIEVVSARDAGPGPAVSATEAAAWTPEQVKELVTAADHPDAEVVLLPCTALHTAGYVPELEELLGKPVLTANQVTVWEGLRLVERRVWAPTLGTLFATREPPPGAVENRGIEVRE
ncbi:MAG TPA: decarboxylase [Streptomyces sp.]|uniref:Aspartate/glutamate racemase family protein n=1 Tax=Streptomyces salyersiae TaxID=3075530 RepID=A0ABU2RBH9_9ACTN|nr:aspartate/glutamate racemase family protein [Streptomyces sp. DSM 41770]MDT0426222.1 aspartate/glutamate racemase family protein [Streptomyces sp. DSM 41770]HBF85367.1 decarboxylase [Streptomyces sp.]